MKIRAAVIAEWVARNGWLCPGYQIDAHAVPVGGLTADHVVPRSIRPDLAYVFSNYAVLCGQCNRRKGNRVD